MRASSVIILLAAGCSSSLAATLPATIERESTLLARQSAASLVGYDYVNVTMVGAAMAAHSWEWGTLSETLLEVLNPTLSVFANSKTSFPSGAIPSQAVSNVKALSFVQPHITTTTSSHTLMADGATGDPASMGVAALMIGKTKSAYTGAATRQLNHLLYEVPRYKNGAISQREGYAELWADFMYMAPPFMAYYAVATNNKTLLKYTVDEIGRQRQILRLGGNNAHSGLWQHIVGPQSQTLGLWSTGNAWSVLGMVRVLATILNWPASSAWTEYPGTLKGFIYEILDGVLASSPNLDPSNGMVRNYIQGGVNNSTDTSFTWFGEGSGTAGIAAAIYRMAILDPSGASKYLAWADAARGNIAKLIGSDGILRPTVDPYDWFNQQPYTAGSPEGQAFAGMLGAAYVDYMNKKAK